MSPRLRYLSREWHDLEKERLWSRVWQFTCRQEQLADIGSYIVYEIADQSYLVARISDTEIKAYPNSCLHRGRLLKTYDGRCSEFRCPYHGFSWHLDGQLKGIPAEWDFPQLEVRRDEMTLPEVKVGVWAGFVFINPDPDAEPLEDFLGPEIQRHFDRWDFENRYIAAHACRVIRCNWKIANEAFSEGFHVNATHPQGMSYTGDPQGQIDVWGNTARQLSPKGIPCPLLDYTPTEEEMWRDSIDVREGEPLPVPFAEGDTFRGVLSATGRERFRPTFGDRVDDLTDAEFIDAWNYLVFPNFHPWGAFNRIVYRFRPNGDDHETCLFDMMYLAPFSGERPPPAEAVQLGPDDPWTDAPGLEKLAMVAEQGHVQHGAGAPGTEGPASRRRDSEPLPGSARSLAPRPHRRVRRPGTGGNMSATSDQRPPTEGGIKHGFSGAMYSRIGDDRVQVVMPDGTVGIFDGVGSLDRGRTVRRRPRDVRVAQRRSHRSKPPPERTKVGSPVLSRT